MSIGIFMFIRNFFLFVDWMWILLIVFEYCEIWGVLDDNQVLEIILFDFLIGGVDYYCCGFVDQFDFEVKMCWYNIDVFVVVIFIEIIIVGGMVLGVSFVIYVLLFVIKGCDFVIIVVVVFFVGLEMMDEFKVGWIGGMLKLDWIVV